MFNLASLICCSKPVKRLACHVKPLIMLNLSGVASRPARLSNILKDAALLIQRPSYLKTNRMAIVFFPHQAFFTTAFGLSSGAVVTSMSLDRVAALYKPFFYKQHATPLLSRTICAFLTMFCLALAALPFFGIGKYKFNQSSRSFCQFDWFPVTLTETVNSLAIAVCGVTLITVTTVSNTTVFVIVVRIRRRMSAVLPSDMNSKRRARRFAFRQEERMAKFVALASVVFLFTWLPVTVSSCSSPFISSHGPTMHVDA